MVLIPRLKEMGKDQGAESIFIGFPGSLARCFVNPPFDLKGFVTGKDSKIPQNLQTNPTHQLGGR